MIGKSWQHVVCCGSVFVASVAAKLRSARQKKGVQKTHLKTMIAATGEEPALLEPAAPPKAQMTTGRNTTRNFGMPTGRRTGTNNLLTYMVKQQ